MSTYSGRGLHGQVVHELGARILSGRIASGQTIDLMAMESDLGVSRTVLREALKVLGAKGLVGARQKRGTFVTPKEDWNMLDADVIGWQVADEPTEVMLEQLAELRWIIEPAAASLAALRRDAADLDGLLDALDGMRVPDPAAVVAADLAFHSALLKATHNPLLGGLDNVIEQGLRLRDVLVHSHPASADPVPVHRAVLQAVRDADPSAADAAMRALLTQAGDDFTALRAALLGAATKKEHRQRGRREGADPA